MLKEEYIPANNDSNYLFKIWNNTVSPFHRDVRDHSHSPFEIVYFKSGKGLYDTGSGVHTIDAGDIFIFSSNEQHCITDIYEGEPFSFVNIHFDPIFLLSSGRNGFSEENAGVCFGHAADFINKLSNDNPSFNKIAQNILEIESECERKLPEYELSVKNLIYDILIRLLRDFGYKNSDDGKKTNYSSIKTVRKVTMYINSHLTEDIYLKELSEHVGLTPNYLCTLFKEIVGVSLWDYINEKRIEKAGKLILENKELNVLEIAVACGFNNTANFNKAFKRYTGTTPSVYRKGINEIMF